MATMLDEKDGYQATLAEIERDLYGPPRTAFPLQVDLAGQAYQFSIWGGQQLPDQHRDKDSREKTEAPGGLLLQQVIDGNFHGAHFRPKPATLTVNLKRC